MTQDPTDMSQIFPLMRPALLSRAASAAARAYRRDRDLPGAIPGLAGQPVATILGRLVSTEAAWEEARRQQAPGYRPARHVQVLSALLAEAGALGARAA
ncbi:MAG: DUF6477 family protein [Paracoccaceae bacterium]